VNDGDGAALERRERGKREVAKQLPRAEEISLERKRCFQEHHFLP
jgi:hypothetical protein